MIGIRKILLLNITLLCMLVQMTVYAQGHLEKRITVDIKKQKLSDALTTIGKLGGFSFSYASNSIKRDSIVTFKVLNKTVRQVLDTLLGGDMKYLEVERYVVIQPDEKEKWYTISGRVMDGQTGSGLPDATVFERNQLASALTDGNGYYRLHLKDREKFRNPEITVMKGFYSDTSLTLLKGYDQEIDLTIRPETYVLPDLVVTQKNTGEKAWYNKWLVSAKLKTQSINLKKFFVSKPYQMSLVPGIGTHGKMSGQVANRLSVNVLGGYSAGADGVELGGLFNLDRNDVQYVQAAGMLNGVDGNAKGVQAAGLINYVTKNVDGTQCAGIINKAGNVDGVQAAGVANMAVDTVNGVQVSGVMNGAGVASCQVAGFVNAARVNTGLQLAGFVNVAHKATGVQFAGFLNIADSSDFPIGFVNIVKNGDKAIGFSMDEYGTSMLSLRSGGRITYGLIGLGINHLGTSKLYALEAGLGAHIRIVKHFRVNMELATLSEYDKKDNFFLDNSFRILPAVRVGPAELYAGAGFNVSIYNYKPDYLTHINDLIWTGTNATSNVDMRIGYKAGVQFYF